MGGGGGEYLMMDKCQKLKNHNGRLCSCLLDTFNHLFGIGYAFVSLVEII